MKSIFLQNQVFFFFFFRVPNPWNIEKNTSSFFFPSCHKCQDERKSKLFCQYMRNGLTGLVDTFSWQRLPYLVWHPPPPEMKGQFFRPWKGTMLKKEQGHVSSEASPINFQGIYLEPRYNQFKVDVWWNNDFPCKDLESSNWNNHKKKRLFRVPGTCVSFFLGENNLIGLLFFLGLMLLKRYPPWN